MLPEVSFRKLFASEMLNEAGEKWGFICQRDKLLAAESLKLSLPTFAIADISPLQGMSVALVTNVHPPGKPKHSAQLLSTGTALVML